MPKKSSKPTMGDRIDNLEEQMTGVQATLEKFAQQMHDQSERFAQQMQDQSLFLSELSRKIGQKEVNSGASVNSVGDSIQSESRLSGKKVKLPVFDGDDPVAWITRAEIYFDVQNTADEMRVKLARLSMEGPTIHWFNLLRETEDDLSWEKLKKALIARYGGRRLENPFEELATLKQTGSVEDYVEAFELLSSQVGRLPEEQYLGYFMSGLKPQIRRRVRTLNPLSRMQMMRIAKDVEEELKEADEDEGRGVSRKGVQDRGNKSNWAGSFSKGQNGSHPNRSFNSGWSNPSPKSHSAMSKSNSNTSMATTGRTGPWKGVRSVQNSEIVERRAKGLCFKCGERWHPTMHKCPEKALRVLILGEGETVNEEGEIISIEEEVSEEEEAVEVECKSLGVLGSMNGYRTMKVEGKVENVDVLVLIDSGASHNFISPQITTALGLPVSPMAAKSIKLGDGHKIVSKGVCEGVKIKLGPMDVVVDALVLELGGLDMGNKEVQLQGQGSQPESYLNTFLDDKQRRVGTDWWWSQQQTDEVSPNLIPSDLETILTQFQDVFKDQIQLPPERSQVHHIKLLPTHGAINVRPYRYPHHQKEEIERQVAELLQAGVIRPSMSDFSSPVILVKKKDKSWRMCVDYRALNKATIPDNKNVSEHQKHLHQVLSILLTNCFVANQAKCKFGCEQIEYLGHIISGAGVSVDPDKVKCMLEWPEPKSVKGVRGFLGLTGYYRKFIKDYGKLAKPLTELTKKDNFVWSPDATAAFNIMKQVMTSPPVLVLPNFELPFEVECDASGRGIGAVLMQQRKPIAFFSKALFDGNLAKSIYEKESMALVLCIQHWRHYLLGKQFIVYTDHKSLKHFLQQRVTSPDQQGWLAKLLGYQFEVKYKPGMENKAADALSRCYDEIEYKTLVSYPQWLDSKKLLDEVHHDAEIQNMIQEVQNNPTAKPGFSIKQGVLFYYVVRKLTKRS
ncbi:retrotransposon-related protein [Trifolium pratense]|uniref:RNA-directed DNA polymerase n=1 Tax=Trifolium pratense TaxID=57577 RepID=A0A2K3N8G8_TRIPR|nr:retrotransposon-related protein [Trifolium pratense]